MEQINRIGMDTSKHFFQLHGVNAAEKVVLRKKLRRKEMVAFFKALAPTVIGIEACGASHYWARLLRSFGHEVKLIAPQLVKPYVKRGKNDGADAEALCEAMSRPTMRFVPVKTAEQQAALMMVGLRDRLIEVDAKLMAWHKANECSRRLAKIPSVGPTLDALDERAKPITRHPIWSTHALLLSASKHLSKKSRPRLPLNEALLEIGPDTLHGPAVT